MKRYWLTLPLLPLLVGCGASAPSTTPDFTLSAAPSSVSLVDGGSSHALIVTVGSVGSFNKPVNVSLSGLPSGVTASPATLTISPGALAQFNLTASGAASGTSSGVSVVASAGTISHSIPATVTVVQSLSSVSLNDLSFDFGNNLVGSTLTRSVVTVTNTGAQAITLAPTLSGDPSYSLVTPQTCTGLAAGASCSISVSYTPTVASGSTPQTATLNLGLGNVLAGTTQTISLTGISAAVPQGTVTATNNPQVAQYSITLPFPGSVTVSFGTDTTYGRQTWSRSTTNYGQTISILVAGMLPNTLYHMRAAMNFTDGPSINDVDHTFTTGTPEVQPNLLVTTTPGMTPQSGIEQLSMQQGAAVGIVDTDLQGNVLWSYALPNNPVGQDGADTIDGVKLMQNGHFLITIGQGSSYALSGGPTPTGVVTAVREIDLAGNIIREITATDLSNELQAAGYNITLSQFHHDVVPMANGHWIVLASTFKQFASVAGETGPQNVLGDVVIDLDQNLQPVWVWNEFDHLDVNRHPMDFPDWTHTNTVLYSPTDHNLIISMRHQNWVIKVDYEDGAGSGNILWHLGEGGDFKLVGGTDPTDWNYAQHFPSLFTPNSAGVFSLGLMDNGDDRILPDGGTCGTGSEPACYSTVPVFQIDETAKTATLSFHQVLPSSVYNAWGGNTDLLGNGDIEYDLCGLLDGTSIIREVTPDPANPQTVWEMQLFGSQAYRGYRIPSLYPGVQW